MAEAEVSNSSGSVNTPEKLKFLGLNVESFQGNTILHQIVLDDSIPNNSAGERYIHAALQSISINSVNELTDDGFSALHLAVLKENLLMVKKLLSCLGTIDVNAQCVTFSGNTAFHMAVGLGNISISTLLLDQGVDVNVKNLCGQIPLHLAIESCNLATVEFLVEKGAVVNSEDNDGLTPLHYATKSGDFKTIECLVKNGANVNALKANVKTVLHIAGKYCDFATFMYLFDKSDHVIKNNPTLLHQVARSGNAAKLALLVDENTDVNTRDDSGHSPLQLAILSGNSENIKFLVDANANVNAVNVYGKSVLNTAVESGDLSVINLLMSKGAVLNDENKDSPMLFSAVGSGNLATVEFILDHCPNVNVQNKHGETPIFYAALGNHVEVVKVLLDRGANVDAVNTSHNPLHIAAMFGGTEVAQILLERGSQVDAKDEHGFTPLLYVLESDALLDSGTVNVLINWGADRDAKCPKGNTALHYACLMSKFIPEIFNVLLDGHADARVYVCATNTRGCTPIHCAAKSNNMGALKVLLEKGARLNRGDVNGDTPLHYASKRGHAKFVKALLKRRVKVNVKGKRGRTPLHLAAFKDEKEVLKALLKMGADVNAVDDDGNTPHHYTLNIADFLEESDED